MVSNWVRKLEEKGLAKGDVRICFAIEWFKNEKGAIRFGKEVQKSGATYNGGWFHGMACGREESRDWTDADGVRWYAVSH